jgi:hypothetical protein
LVGYRTDGAGGERLNAVGALKLEDAVMPERHRVKHKLTFEERLAEEALRFKEAAEKEPPGSMARELLLRRVRQAETASRLSQWLTSPVRQ